MMSDRQSKDSLLSDELRSRFKDAILDTSISRGEITHLVDKKRLIYICRFLKSEAYLNFNFLSDLLAVDYHPRVPRFEVVYHLYSIPKRHRLRLKIQVKEGESVPSVTGIWRSADWAEREAYDMFGIVFEGHPDMRRIYMPDDWDGFPLRKDYPLRGYRDKYNPFGEEKR